MPLDFIIGGAQKSASTYIHELCAAHPAIIIPNGEITVFEDYNTAQEISTVVAALHRQERATGKLFGVKRPSLLCCVECLNKIYSTYPNTKLIFVLRNPTDRAISAYFHQIRFGTIPVQPVDLGMEQVLSGTLEKHYPRAAEIIEFGRYGKYLNLYLEKFGSDNILTFLYEDIQQDKERIIRRLYKFLGVDASFFPTDNIGNTPMKSMYIRPEYATVLRLKNKLSFTYNADKTRLEKRRVLPRALGRLLEDYIIAPNNQTKPPISSTLRKNIYRQYEQDITLLEKTLDRDLSFWRPQ